MVTVAVLAAHREKNLANAHSGTSSLWLTEGTPHSRLKPVGPGTGKHLVDPQNMERMNPNSQMEGIFPGILGHVFVACNTCCFKSLA